MAPLNRFTTPLVDSGIVSMCWVVVATICLHLSCWVGIHLHWERGGRWDACNLPFHLPLDGRAGAHRHISHISPPLSPLT